MPRQLVNGVYLHVERHAGPPGGPVLLLLHGFTGSAATWAPHLDVLTSICTVVAIDALGHGHSDAPADPQRYAMRHVIADTLAVMNRLAIERFALLGYSMGGRMALHVATAAGERLDALILESASPGLRTEAERRARITADGELAALAEREGIAAFVARWEAAPLWASQATLPAQTLDTLREQRLQANPLGLANSLRGAGTGVQGALHDLLPTVPTPTLLIAGARDAKFCALARNMHEAMPQATLEIVEDAGHAVHLEAPEQFDRLVTNFIRRHTWHP